LREIRKLPPRDPALEQQQNDRFQQSPQCIKDACSQLLGCHMCSVHAHIWIMSSVSLGVVVMQGRTFWPSGGFVETQTPRTDDRFWPVAAIGKHRPLSTPRSESRLKIAAAEVTESERSVSGGLRGSGE